MDDVTRVQWREWGRDAFEEAAEADRAVLLSLTATWCGACHEMDAETYADPRIAANVDDGFVPVRVDVDRNPRVRDRYNTGGFPSTVFLASDGSVLSGAGYLGPDGMSQVVERVRRAWDRKGTEAGRIPRALGDDDPPAGELTAGIERRMLGRLAEAHDEVAGGWGDEPKFPLPDALEFAVKRDRERALRSFDAVGGTLLDEREGGFYRFAAERDWSGVHREKVLDENAALVRAFATAYLYTGRDEYREPAARTIDYLTTTLWRSETGADGADTDDERGAFAGSQAPGDIDPDALESSDRESRDGPPVDDTVYAGSNALAIEALLTYHAYTDDDRARRYAERALATVRGRLLEGGVTLHYRDDPAGAGSGTGTGREDPETGSDDGDDEGERCLLANQARLLAALTTARSVLGEDALDGDPLADARAVADATIDRLRDGGSFLDGPAEGPGLLDRPLRPLEANVELADALLDLSILAGEPRYRTVAREALAAFAGASDRFGPRVARYASATARLLEGPLVVRVAAPAGSDLHRAALRVADHEKVVIPDASPDPGGGLAAGTARLEYGDRVSDPAATPAEVSERVGEVLD